MIKDYFKLAWENIAHRRLRSILTVIGIVIGIATVVALVSLGQGVQKVIVDEFAKAGTDKIFVQPGQNFGGGNVRGLSPLTDDDLEVVGSTKGVKEVTGLIDKSGKVEYDDTIFFVPILGMPIDSTLKLVEEAWNIDYIDGRPLKSGDRYKAVVGNGVAYNKEFGKNANIGDKFILENKTFQIVGVLKPVGDPGVDGSILIPKETAYEIFEDSGLKEESIIVARTEPGVDPALVAEDIKRELRKSRNVDEGEEDFSIQTIEQLLDSFKVILQSFTAIIIGVAAISLFVGGVGIMNTMYTAVLQRTNEIGTMKAIGAKNDQILTLFLLESGMLGIIGGVIGLLFGMGLSSIIAYIGRTALNSNLLYAYFPWYLIVGSLAFAFIIGAISGVLPALQASKQSPVEALRYE